MAPQTPEDWLWLLSRRLENQLPALRHYDSHYEGTQPLMYLHPALLLEVTPRIKQLVLGWEPLVVDSLEERLDGEGFQFRDEPEADQDLWDVWQANGMDEASQTAHVDALVMGRSYVIVGSPDRAGDPPLVTVESPMQVIHDVDPRTRKIRAAIKRTVDPVAGAAYATVYLNGQTTWFERVKGAWRQSDQDNHGFPVPVVALRNRTRTLSPWGTSELKTVMPMADAANKIATDMMVGAEHHAVPRRAFFGVDPDDFVDEDGKQLNAWQIAIGKNWTHPDAEVKAIQFPAADLSNFHETINSLARMAAAAAALPPSYLGLAADDAASADAIRSREARLVKRAERKQRSFGGSWEDVMRLVLAFQGRTDVNAHSLEMVWRNAATPTQAQTADAVTKEFTSGLIPREEAWVELGKTSAQITRMKRMLAEEDAATLAAFKLPPAPQLVNPSGQPVSSGAAASG